MILGPCSICKVDLVENSDSPIYTTLVWGYDTARVAYNELARVAEEDGMSADACCVIRHID